MAGTDSILLMESEQSVIKDVTCSLRLIGIPIMTALTLPEAIETAKKYKPNMVIARLKMGDTHAGIELAKSITESAELANTKIYALCSKSDQPQWEPNKKHFTGQFMLPVEFPAFAKEVSALLKDSAPQVSVVESKPAQPVQSQVAKPSEEVVVAKQAKDYDPEVKDKNFALAYAIQSKVLRELEQDGRLNNAPIQQVPGILNQVTAKVCIKFATEKILT